MSVSKSLAFLLPMCIAMTVGCGGKPDTQVIESSGVVAPSEAEAQTAAYQEEMKKMNN
jgi:hypothetical protein